LVLLYEIYHDARSHESQNALLWICVYAQMLLHSLNMTVHFSN